MTEPTVRRAGQHYEIRVEGELAGITQFRDKDGRRVFFHTETAEAFRGRGLSSVLIADALDDTRAAGLRVVPVCPAVAAFVEKHADYRDLADPVDDAILAWLDAQIQNGEGPGQGQHLT